MTTEAPQFGNGHHRLTEVGLDAVPGRGRVPGQRPGRFDLPAFARALEERDLDYQLDQYAAAAEVHLVDPDNPPTAPQTVRGRPAIRAWLLHARTRDLDLRVTHLVDGGDRVAFTEHWHHSDGTAATASSTADIESGLITMRHMILVWDSRPV